MASQGGEWIGVEIAEGRYKILGRIGQGNMGSVYLAYDRHLETDVVLKFPGTRDEAAAGPEFLDRFAREIRSLVRLSHPHIVKVIDAGALDGHPFVVMQFLAGGSLKDRMLSGPAGEFRPMPPGTLGGWLLEIAKALDFVHAQRHIHRDVKPANILFDRHDNAFLGDFGIIKALASDEGADWRSSALTAPGFLLGTPNYVAPEIVMGRPFDGRVDQYALAMTVHEVLCGRNCMEGPTPSATVVNQTMVVPPALEELIPGMPRRLSDAVLRGLAKDPDGRFESCTAMAREVLASLPADAASTAATARVDVTSLGRPGHVPCPACGAAMPVGREHAGGRIRCMGCQAISAVSLLSSNTVQLRLVGPDDSGGSPPDSGSAQVYVVGAPDDEAEPDPSALTAPVERPATAPREQQGSGRHLRATALLACGALALILILGAVWFRGRSNLGRHDRPEAKAISSEAQEVRQAAPPAPREAPVEINIAYGTEKQQWFEAAAAAFRKSEAGRGIAVVLHGMGSIEGARAVLDGPEPIPMQVWSPASSAYRDTFERGWRAKHGKSPILKAENLVLTPLVFVMWEGRHEAFMKKYSRLRFRTVADAMWEPGGWGTIAGHPDWGRFKFGHTDPEQSNSGLLTLVLMACEFAGKEYNLSRDEVASPAFRGWLRRFEQGVVRPGGALTHSTGSLMREMVLRGPSQYDCLLVYENLAVGYLDAAKDRYGQLVVDYPEPNMWRLRPREVEKCRVVARITAVSQVVSWPLLRARTSHMDDLSRFCCLNSRCADFGRRGAGNLTVTGRLGKYRQYRLLYCRTCRDRFSERKGTPLYRAHLPEDQVASILEHITEGCGVLQTARLVKVHPDTVSRYTRAAGEQAAAAHDELVARSPATREIQMDEAWSFVAKKEKNCDEDEPEDQFHGDCWDHVAFDPEHRLVVAVVPGARTAESVQELVNDVKERLDGRVPALITTDEYSAYEGAILEAFGTEVVPPRTGKPGRPRGAYEVPPVGLNYATVHKTRKKGRVVEVTTRVIFGTTATVEAALADSSASRTVNTAFVERHNGTDRNRNARKVRKTYCFSKDWWIHRAATFFSKYTYNFCWPVRTLKAKGGEVRTPAMMAKLTDHMWTLAEWIKRPAVQFA